MEGALLAWIKILTPFMRRDLAEHSILASSSFPQRFVRESIPAFLLFRYAGVREPGDVSASSLVHDVSSQGRFNCDYECTGE